MRLLVALLGILLSPTSAFAQEGALADGHPDDGGESSTAEYDQDGAGRKVTTSARTPMPAFDTERSDNVVSDEQIREQQANSITDALAEEPGILVQSTNRGAGTLILRGLVGPENLIYFDGVRFNQSTFRTGPNQYLDTIDPWALRQIEVVRGPGSVLYGSGAMGGVIQLFPHELPDQTVASSRLGFRSADNTAAVNLDGGSATGGLSASAGFTFRRHGQLRVGSNSLARAPFIAGIDGGRFLAQPFEQYYWRGGVGYEHANQRVRVNYFGGAISDAMRIDRVGDGEVREYDNQDHLTYVTYELDGPSGIDEFSVNMSWHRTAEVVDRRNCERIEFSDPATGADLDRVSNVVACSMLDRSVVARRRINKDVVDTFGSSIAGVSRLLDRDLSITWGGDAYTDRVQSTREDARAPDFVFEPRDRGNFADGSTFSTVGIFGLGRYDVWSSGPSLFRAHAGARVENFRASAPEVTAELGDVDYSFVGLVGSGGIAYLHGTNLNAYLNWNQGFRAPNLQESTVLGDSGNFYEVPNADLGPERSDTFELGAKVDLAEVVRIRPALWVSLVSDRITRAPTTFEGQSELDGKGVRHRVNRDSAYFYGADLGASTYDWNGASLFGNFSISDGAVATDAEDPNFVAGPLHELLAGGDAYENPRRLPPVQYLVGLRYEPEDNWYAELFVQGAGTQSKLAPGDIADQRICEARLGVFYEELGEECPGSPAWATVNARAGYRHGSMSLDVAALNITDERYRRHGSGVPGSGFNLAAQLSLEY